MATLSPHIRRWANEQETQRERRRMGFSWLAWLAVIVGALAAYCADSAQQSRTATYRALPSADVRLLTMDQEDRRLTEMVEREWRRIEGR